MSCVMSLFGTDDVCRAVVFNNRGRGGASLKVIYVLTVLHHTFLLQSAAHTYTILTAVLNTNLVSPNFPSAFVWNLCILSELAKTFRILFITHRLTESCLDIASVWFHPPPLSYSAGCNQHYFCV